MTSAAARAAAIATAAALTIGCARAPTAPHPAPAAVAAPRPAPALKSATPRRRGMLWYRLDLTGARLRLTARIVRPARSMTLFLPAPHNASARGALPFTFMSARTPRGPIAIERGGTPGAPHVVIEPGDAAWVEISYEVDAPRQSASGTAPTFFDPKRGALAWMPALLLLPSRAASHTLAAIPIEVRAPPTWQIASSWGEPRAERAHHDARSAAWIAPEVRALRDAFVWAAPGARRRERRDKIAVHFGADFAGDRGAIADLIARTILDLRARYGQRGQVDALVLSGPRRDGAGRLGGFVIWLEPGAAADDRQLEALIAHEALHLWNGHAVYPAPGDRARALWFHEGVTHWLALDALVERGAWSDAERDRAIVAAAARLVRAPARAKRRPYDEGLLFAARAACADRRAPSLWLIALLAHARRGAYRATALAETAAKIPALGDRFAREVERFLDADSLERARIVRARAIAAKGASAGCAAISR